MGAFGTSPEVCSASCLSGIASRLMRLSFTENMFPNTFATGHSLHREDSLWKHFELTFSAVSERKLTLWLPVLFTMNLLGWDDHRAESRHGSVICSMSTRENMCTTPGMEKVGRCLQSHFSLSCFHSSLTKAARSENQVPLWLGHNRRQVPTNPRLNFPICTRKPCKKPTSSLT